ncbi:MAG: outer membrane beta-barrel protein [Alphaproteobacteria bacterium]|nr:outer membrane beta-barrel protein [Alphaproteobacteria bacterium]
MPRVSVLALGLALFGFAPCAALAQEPPEEVPRGATVADRPRPDYDPPGVRAGSFLIFPELAVQEQYESNIFATENNERADLITAIIPSIRVKSDWNNHAVSFLGDATVVKYADNDSEDFVDRTFGADGRLDIRRDARLFGGAAYRVRHEERSSPDNVAAAVEPIEYTVYSAVVGGEKEFNRLGFRLDNIFERYEFQDATNGFGQTIDQSGRDRNQFDVRLRTSYDLMPMRQVYLVTGYNRRDYNRDVDAGGVDRDSHGYTAGPGFRYDIDGIVFFDLFLGVRRQEFADPRLNSVTGVVGDGRVTWNVTRLTTITGTVTRDLRETSVAGSSAYFATRSELRADHELLRNVLLNARIGYQRDDFEDIDRTDNYYSAGAGAKYLINRNFVASAGYGYRQRESDRTSDFVDHTFTVRLTSHF